jgi:hypothetical protein
VGFEVDLVIPNKQIYRDNPFDYPNVNIIYSNEKINNATEDSLSKTKSLIPTKFKSIVKKVYHYFFTSELFQTYNNGITKLLVSSNKEYDALISISQPLSIHLSVVIAKIMNEKMRNPRSIAEFSDPMFKGDYTSAFSLNLLLGFKFSFCFKYFVVPVSTAKQPFSYFNKHPYFKEFSYEDVVYEGEINKIASFIGCDDVDITYTSRTRQSTSEKYGYIKNFKKLRKMYEQRMYGENLFNSNCK